MTEDRSLVLRVVYSDPHLIEVEARVEMGFWSGVAAAYTTPGQLGSAARRLEEWARHPEGECLLEVGADTGIGWIHLAFHEINKAGHLSCRMQIAGGNQTNRSDMEPRLSIQMHTECGLVIRFAQHLRSLAETLAGEATLVGVRP